MSSDDDYDAFLDLINKQKNKLRKKYIEKAQVKSVDDNDSFIVDDDCEISESSFNSDDSYENNAGENQNSGIKSSYLSSPELDNQSEVDITSPKINKNLKNTENKLQTSIISDLFSDDSSLNISEISTEFSDNSFEFNTPKVLKNPAIHSKTAGSILKPSSLNLVNDASKQNAVDFNNSFKTPVMVKTKVLTKQGQNYTKETKKMSLTNTTNKENIFKTPKMNTKKLHNLMKTASSKPNQSSRKFTNFKPMSDSEGSNLTDEDDDEFEDFIDDSPEYPGQSSLSDEESASDISWSSDDVDTVKTSKFVTPTQKKKINPQRLTQTAPSKGNLEPLDFIPSLMDDVDEHRRHPEAVEFRHKFKLKKEELAMRIYKIYNETAFENILPENIEILWSGTLRKTAGVCCCSRTRLLPVTHTIKIKLSTKVLTDPCRLLKTLVHEMCHGAAWMIDKVKADHGPIWKQWTWKAHKAFPLVPISSRCHNYNIHYKFQYWCLACERVVKRHSKSIDIKRKVCGTCKGKFTLYRIAANGEKIIVEEKQNLNAFSAFVKENYNKYRKVGTSHAGVMKQLSEQYKLVNEKVKDDLSSMLEGLKLIEKEDGL